MNIISRTAMAGTALALAGCSYLPGANLGDTFTAESYLGTSIEGSGFNAALAREYQALAVRSARTDVNWMDSTAYIAKSEAAAAGGVAPWTPAELGVSPEIAYDDVVSTLSGAPQWSQLQFLEEFDHRGEIGASSISEAIDQTGLDFILVAIGYTNACIR